MQSFCGYILEKDGFDVHIADNGGKGVSEFERLKPDLVLLDIMLPVLDGWGVCREIRSDLEGPNYHADGEGRNV